MKVKKAVSGGGPVTAACGWLAQAAADVAVVLLILTWQCRTVMRHTPPGIKNDRVQY